MRGKRLKERKRGGGREGRQEVGGGVTKFHYISEKGVTVEECI